MKFKDYINEEYETRIKDYGKSYEVFSNPSRSDMLEVNSNTLGFKFIADNKKKMVFIWNVYGPLHEPAWYQLNSADFSNDVFSGRVLPGYAKLKGSKAELDGLDGNDEFEEYIKIHGLMLDDILKKWKWVEKYINITKFFKSM